MELHEKISQVREAKKISRAEMATALNMSSQSYWNVETGKTELTVSRLHQISKILGVSAIELLTGEEQKVQDSEEVEKLRDRVKELEDRVKDKEESNRRMKKDLSEAFNLEFIYTAIRLGLVNDNGEIMEKEKVEVEFYTNTLVQELMNNDLISKSDPLYQKWLEEKKQLNESIKKVFANMAAKIYQALSEQRPKNNNINPITLNPPLSDNYPSLSSILKKKDSE